MFFEGKMICSLYLCPQSAFAIVEFDTSEAVKLALNEKDIISLDGRRLTVKPRTVKDKTERNPFNSSVVVERLSVQKSQAKSSEDNAECTSAIFQQLVNYISETKQVRYFL